MLRSLSQRCLNNINYYILNIFALSAVKRRYMSHFSKIVFRAIKRWWFVILIMHKNEMTVFIYLDQRCLYKHLWSGPNTEIPKVYGPHSKFFVQDKKENIWISDFLNLSINLSLFKIWNHIFFTELDTYIQYNTIQYS